MSVVCERRKSRAPEEFLTVHLIEFADDVLDSILETRYHDVLNGVNSSVGCTNDVVEDHEGSLERSELNECLNGFRVDFPSFDDLLATTPQTGQVEIYLVTWGQHVYI
jgi:hypothetical protein